MAFVSWTNSDNLTLARLLPQIRALYESTRLTTCVCVCVCVNTSAWLWGDWRGSVCVVMGLGVEREMIMPIRGGCQVCNLPPPFPSLLLCSWWLPLPLLPPSISLSLSLTHNHTENAHTHTHTHLHTITLHQPSPAGRKGNIHSRHGCDCHEEAAAPAPVCICWCLFRFSPHCVYRQYIQVDLLSCIIYVFSSISLDGFAWAEHFLRGLGVRTAAFIPGRHNGIDLVI